MQTHPFVGGLPSTKTTAWNQVTTNPLVLNWIFNGVPIPFTSPPPSFEINNRIFSNSEYHFIKHELDSLLKSKCIVRCNSEEKPHCVSGISVVPKKAGDFRLILDLRKVNDFCDPPKFSYTDINSAVEIIDPGDRLVTLDIKSGFHHIRVYSEHTKYLGFKFDGTYYKFVVLPFGLNCSPYYFHKCLRPVIEHFADKSIKCVVYVDDFLISASSEEINISKNYVISMLHSLGWFINYDKSSLVPECRKTFIGFIIDSAKSKHSVWIEIPKERIRKVRHDIARVLKRQSVTARGLARITGQLISMSKAVIPAKLLLRNAYRLLKSRSSWSDILLIDQPTHNDLAWWFVCLKNWNGRSIADSSCRETIQIATDASAHGWGGNILNSIIQAQGVWTSDMVHSSSNMREISAVLLCLQSFAPTLRGKRVQILTDNVTCAAYINFQGGMHADLSSVATQIWSLAIKNNLTISAKWLAGKLNTIPDYLSRLDNKHNWKIHPDLFRYLDNIWGPHTMDRFACMNSAQCAKYNSLFLDPTTSGVDALSQTDWREENNFVNAPLRLLPQVLNKLDQYQAFATIIAPMFRAQPFFLKLINRSIAAPIKLPNARLFCLPMSNTLPEPLRNQKWKFYAWRVCGRRDCWPDNGL